MKLLAEHAQVSHEATEILNNTELIFLLADKSTRVKVGFISHIFFLNNECVYPLNSGKKNKSTYVDK